MKLQASFSSKDKSKIIKVSSAAILLGALMVKQFFSQKQRMIISWPTLFFFEVASSLIVLHCTLRKIQQNIQGGGA